MARPSPIAVFEGLKDKPSWEDSCGCHTTSHPKTWGRGRRASLTSLAVGLRLSSLAWRDGGGPLCRVLQTP